jgi:hypothetical protein
VIGAVVLARRSGVPQDPVLGDDEADEADVDEGVSP